MQKGIHCARAVKGGRDQRIRNTCEKVSVETEMEAGYTKDHQCRKAHTVLINELTFDDYLQKVLNRSTN